FRAIGVELKTYAISRLAPTAQQENRGEVWIAEEPEFQRSREVTNSFILIGHETSHSPLIADQAKPE
ncbi:MAG: hypothetical protein ACOVQM_20725, partial [Pirellula sp.]